MSKKQMKPVEVHRNSRTYVNEKGVTWLNGKDVDGGLEFNGRGLNRLGVALFGKLWTPTRPIPPQLACVYAAEMSDDTVKIGVSIKPYERVQQVAGAVYLKVKRVHHTAFAPRSFMYDIESRCHATFDDRRARSEFFNITFEEAVAELNSHADEIATALAKADQRYLAEVNYFFNEYLVEYEKTHAIDNEEANLDGARARFECERMNLEHARERLNDAVAEKNIAKAKLLRELALVAKDNDLCDELIRQAAKLLTDLDSSR